MFENPLCLDGKGDLSVKIGVLSVKQIFILFYRAEIQHGRFLDYSGGRPA